MAISLIFTNTPNSILSTIVRAATFSEFSHCVIVIDEYVYQSSWRVGVTKTLKEDSWLPEHELTEVPLDDVSKVQQTVVKRALESQIGKSYDYIGILGFLINRNWQQEDSWFCSELLAWSLNKAGFYLVNRETGRVTPQDLWESMTLKPYREKMNESKESI